ncbi:NAD(P)H-binding protein [Streptomyces sp. NPDC001678]|uniref:NAD(P)H-binding protein n=1 Tax=Streptomyces sp. NPDC001678 TaxID=3364599 RepID=UPI00368E536F
MSDVLVTGATGRVGRRVVAGLMAAGVRVRALTRAPEAAGLPPGVEVHKGDLTLPDTLPAALEGVGRLYLFPVPETAREVAALAREAGVRRVVVLSSSSVLEGLEELEELEGGDDEALARNHSALHHLTVERAVEESGVDWTFVRPDEFAGNVLWKWRDSIRAEGVVRAPYGKAARALIHEADVADVAVAALLEDGHVGGRYQLTGPATLTQIDQVRAIAEALGRDIRFEELSHEEGRAAMSAHMPPPVVEMVLGYLAASTAVPGPVVPTVRDITGHEPRSFARWAADHVHEFR